MIRRGVTWLDERLGGASFVRSALRKAFPDHWSFMLGEIALYAFVVLVLTGVFLGFFFDASLAETTYEGSYEPLRGQEVSDAYASVMELSFDVRAGLVMRQIHHWAALVFIAAILVHLCRIFFTGAFRRPREINWVIGVTMLLLAIFNGFTGYSLPDDLLSGTGLRIAYSIALSIPVVGTWITFLVFGGEFPSTEVIGRLYLVHILIVPATLGALIAVHLAILWRQKHTQFAGPGRSEDNVVGSVFWPTYAARSVGLFFATFAVIAALGGLVQINPVWLYGPFRPEQVTSPAQPDWYVGWLEGALRLFPNWEFEIFGYLVPNPFFPGILLPGITFTLLYAWPFLEAWATKDRLPHHLLDRPSDRPVRTSLGVATLTFYAVLLGAGSNDLIAKWLRISVLTTTSIFRVLVFALPVVLGGATYYVLRAFKRSGVEHPGEMPLSALARRRAG